MSRSIDGSNNIVYVYTARNFGTVQAVYCNACQNGNLIPTSNCIQVIIICNFYWQQEYIRRCVSIYMNILHSTAFYVISQDSLV